MTKRGLVIEGNYKMGDRVLLVFDRASRRYLPLYRKEKDDPVIIMPPEIHTSSKTLYCEVELIDVPTIVSPCHWYSDGIHAGEILGKDYYKTYYRIVNQGNCTNCVEDFSICDTAELEADSGFDGGVNCIPFKYVLPVAPYYQGNPDTIPPIPADSINHCIYSLWGHCQAELISKGEDEQGKFIIWKAYTEWSNVGPEAVDFSRTGLGYMKFEFFLKRSANGPKICTVNQVVQVDCCNKDAINRNVRMWWEWITAGEGFMFYEDLQVWPAPVLMNKYRLYDYALLDSGSFYVFPTVDKSCIPYTWTLTGPGSIQYAGGYGVKEIAIYDPPETHYKDPSCLPVVLTVTDRCGNSDTMTADCCPFSTGPVIAYTALAMGCSQSQELTVSGARISSCPPYEWSMTGGGLLSYPRGEIADPLHEYVTYTAPDANPNCSNNPTITVTDCCGHSTSIQLAINCDSSGGAAIRSCSYVECEDNPGGGVWRATFCEENWDCYGEAMTPVAWDGGYFADCGECREVGSFFTYPKSDRNTSPCGGVSSGLCDNPDQACGTTLDVRTTVMKEAGCCPVNPFTGLPY